VPFRLQLPLSKPVLPVIKAQDAVELEANPLFSAARSIILQRVEAIRRTDPRHLTADQVRTRLLLAEGMERVFEVIALLSENKKVAGVAEEG
jgi:hypothetical protein